MFLPWVARRCDVLVIVVRSLNNQVTAMVLSETFAYTRVYLWIKKGRLEASGTSAKEQIKTHPNMMCKYKMMTSRKGHWSTSTWGNKDVVQPPPCKSWFQPR